MSEAHPPPEPQTAIQANQPPAAPDSGIQANPPQVAAVAPALQQSAFLARLRNLRDMHAALPAALLNPQLMLLVHLAIWVLAGGFGWGVADAMSGMDPNWGGFGFLVTFAAVLGIGYMLLHVVRQHQLSQAQEAIVDFISVTVRSYPTQVEQCGGVHVLADRVELEALLAVLEDRLAAEANRLVDDGLKGP